MKLSKIIADISFNDSFLFNDARTRFEIDKELQKYFDIHIFDENMGAFIFINKSKKHSCFVHSNKIVLQVEEPTEEIQIKSLGNLIVPSIMKKLEVSATTRIGVRAHYVHLTISNPNESNNYVIKEYFGQRIYEFIKEHGKYSNLSPHLGFVLDVNQETKINIQIGISQTGKGEVSPKGIKLITIETANPLIDLDIYTENTKTSEQINGVLRGFSETLNKYAHNMMR